VIELLLLLLQGTWSCCHLDEGGCSEGGGEEGRELRDEGGEM